MKKKPKKLTYGRVTVAEGPKGIRVRWREDNKDRERTSPTFEEGCRLAQEINARLESGGVGSPEGSGNNEDRDCSDGPGPHAQSLVEVAFRSALWMAEMNAAPPAIAAAFITEASMKPVPAATTMASADWRAVFAARSRMSWVVFIPMGARPDEIAIGKPALRCDGTPFPALSLHPLERIAGFSRPRWKDVSHRGTEEDSSTYQY